MERYDAAAAFPAGRVLEAGSHFRKVAGYRALLTLAAAFHTT